MATKTELNASWFEVMESEEKESDGFKTQKIVNDPVGSAPSVKQEVLGGSGKKVDLNVLKVEKEEEKFVKETDVKCIGKSRSEDRELPTTIVKKIKVEKEDEDEMDDFDLLENEWVEQLKVSSNIKKIKVETKNVRNDCGLLENEWAEQLKVSSKILKNKGIKKEPEEGKDVEMKESICSPHVEAAVDLKFTQPKNLRKRVRKSKSSSDGCSRRDSSASSSGSSGGRYRGKKKSVELETDPAVLTRRQKQIDYGKNTIGYERYCQLIPRSQRKRQHPKTPPKHLKYSRRAWDGLVKIWRQQLHLWDPDESDEIDVTSRKRGCDSNEDRLMR